jgi:hypothetical protein
MTLKADHLRSYMRGKRKEEKYIVLDEKKMLQEEA